MKVFDTAQSCVEYLSTCNRPLGMVPTMGALHAGHLSLIEKSTTENQITLVTIFINPTQFDNKNDLENYPTDLASDLSEIEKLGEGLIVYAPGINDVYGSQIHSKPYYLGGLDSVMEGEKRAEHFQGVATVVEYFLTTFDPDHAYFGEKDFQQLCIIRHLVSSLQLKTKIIGCPTVRESDGLAMSSRNRLLNPSQRALAPKLHQALHLAKNQAKKIPYRQIKALVADQFEATSDLRLDYFSIANPETLQELPPEEPIGRGRAFIAAFLGKIRLIDNLDMS
jgi:pantoate--beta-alanine ligase